ncbi:enterotoxin A family protein [Mesorhizobium sp. AaZ16]|uniref:enterotoxin A family protein n=1 Tax=Mesorhizobium sp. AaZ16 TaxID=3402289 RepID=UPI00374F3819
MLQPNLSEGIFNDLAAGKSTEQVAQERGMTREAVITTLAGGNQPVVTPPTSDNGDVRTTVIDDAQGRTITEHYDFQHGTYYTTVQENPQTAPVSNPVRDESGWKVNQNYDSKTGTITTTRVDDLDMDSAGSRVVETSHPNGTRVETTIAQDGTASAVVIGPDGKKVELAPWQSAPGMPAPASHYVRPPHLQDFVGPVATENMLAVGGDQSIPSIQKELAQGRSIHEIAETRGISRDQVIAGMQALGMTVTETQTSVGHVVEVTEPQSGQTTSYSHDYDHDSTNVTVTKPNGNSTSDSIDGNGVTRHTERNAETGAQTTRELDPRSNTTTDITIDADGRRTEVVKAKGADGSEQTTTTVTFNGYQLTTAPNGDRTLTNTSNGDQQTIKAGSVQDSFATMLMEATPNSADPEIARLGQAQKAFAESQLAQTRLPGQQQQAADATQARVDAEGKYGSGRPAEPTLNPEGQVIDPIGAPPPGSPGELIGTPPPAGITQPDATQTPIATNGGTADKWVPINVNGSWRWVHPEVARAAAAEAGANSRVVETNSLITASEADLQVYAKTPEFNGTMRDLRAQVNDALAAHGLQWNPSTAPGTLADAQQAQTLAHDAYGQASEARGHYDQAVTSLDQAIGQQAAMPFYPGGTTPVATAAGSNYDYDAEVAKGKQARADINKLFSDVDLQTKAGDKAIIDFNVSMTGAIDAPPGTLAEGAQPVEIEIGGQKLQVAPEVAEAYNNSGDITALSNGDKPIRVQVDVTRPDGTTGTEWRWVAPETALQSVGAGQQLGLSEAYNNYFGALQTDAALGVELQEFETRAIADYRQRNPHHFDPNGYKNGAGEHTGKLIDSEVVIKDGKLMLQNRYENDVFSGEDGHVLEVALAVNPNDTNYTDEMRGRPLNREWMELAGPTSEGNVCVASPLAAAKGGVESAALELNQLLHSGVTENLAAIDKQLPGLRTDYNELVQTHGTGTATPPEGTLAPGETSVPIQVGGQTIEVAPDVAEQVRSQGLAALTESGKLVYTDIEIPSGDGSMTQLRGWVNPELALAGVRLADAEAQGDQLTQSKSMLDNSIAYNEMRLGNPELLTDTTGTTEAEYLERDEQGALDGIYQGRFQSLLNSGFNNEFQDLDATELSRTIDRTAGIDPSTEDGREARQKIIDEINETGGDNADVRVVPIFYSEEGSSPHQTALYAVRTDEGTRYIDAAGQKFDSLKDFQDNNRQFSEDGKLIVPKNLEMTAGADGRISLDVVQARNVSTWDKVVDPVVGIVGGVATVLSFTPLAPVAAPIAIGSGVYLAGRTAFKQADYLNHGGEWGDKESLMNMGMMAATALPVGGSALRSFGMVRAGIPASRALPGSIGALPMKSGTINLAGREFAYTASPYATQVANYTRTAGGVNMAAHGLDATALTVGAPLVVQSGVDLAIHGGDMSGLELANSVLGLGTGVMGTGAGVRTIATYRPGRGTGNLTDTPGQQTPVIEPDSIIIPGRDGGPEQIVVSGSTRTTADLTPIAGRGGADIIRVRAEDGQMVDAVVLGDQPTSADTIFVHRHGELPRAQDVAGKTHVLLRDPATDAPLILPLRRDGSIPLGLVDTQRVLPAGHQPKEIGPDPPTTHTLEQVRGMRQPDKWQAGEIYIQELNGSAGQQHFPVPLDPNGPFPVTRPGGRHVDAPVHTVRGMEAIEVKTYNLWTTISGAPHMREVPLTSSIQEQINKDVALRNRIPGYEPRWVFLDAPPSAELVQALNDARIIGNIYRHWLPPEASAQATDAASYAPRDPRVTQATVDGQSAPRLFIADGDGNVSRAIFAVDGNGEITPVASRTSGEEAGPEVAASSAERNETTAGVTQTVRDHARPFVFRADTRSPAQIMADGGFSPPPATGLWVDNAEGISLYNYVTGNTRGRFVGTSGSIEGAKAFVSQNSRSAREQGYTYLYVVNPKSPRHHVPTEFEAGGWQLNQGKALEDEVAINGSVPWNEVYGWRKMDPDGNFVGGFTRNEGFDYQAASTPKQRQVVLRQPDLIEGMAEGDGIAPAQDAEGTAPPVDKPDGETGQSPLIPPPPDDASILLATNDGGSHPLMRYTLGAAAPEGQEILINYNLPPEQRATVQPEVSPFTPEMLATAHEVPPLTSWRDKLPDFRIGVTFRARLNTGEPFGIGSPTIGTVGFGFGTKTDFGKIARSIGESFRERKLTPLKDALSTEGVVSVRAREYLNITGLQAGVWPVSNQTAFPVRASDLSEVVKNAVFTDRSGYEIKPSFASVVGKTPEESGSATVIEMAYTPSLKGEDVTLNPGERDFFGVAADNGAGHVRLQDTLPFDRVMTEFKAGLRLPVLANHVDAVDALPRVGYEKRPESPVKDTLKAGDVVSREAYDQIQAALGTTTLQIQFAVKDPAAAQQLADALNRGEGVDIIHNLVEAGQIDPSNTVSYVENPVASGMRLSAVPGKAPFADIVLLTGENQRVLNSEAMLVDVIFNDSNRLPGALAFNPDKFVTSKSYKIKGKANEWRDAHLPDSLHSGHPPQSRSMPTNGNIYENLYGQYGTPATRYTVSLSTPPLSSGALAYTAEVRVQYKSNPRSEPRSIAKDHYTTLKLTGQDGEIYGLYAPQWLGRAAAHDRSAFMIPKGAEASLKRFLDDLAEHAQPDQRAMIENFRNGPATKIVEGTFLRRDDAADVQAFLAAYSERKGNFDLYPLGDHEPIPLGSLVQPEVQAPPAGTVRSWSTDEIGNLSRAELIAIEPRHIAQFTSEQLRGLTPGQMAFLSYDQIAAFRPKQLRALSADQLNGIRPSRVAAIPPGRIAGMNADQIDAFSPLQLKQFTSAQRLKITPDQLAMLDPQQLKALGLDLSQMRGRQFAKLDDTQLGIARENTAWDRLSKEQLRAIPETGTAAIDTAKLTPEQVSWLTPGQIAALMRDQWGAFTVNHFEALTRPQIAAVTPKQLEELGPGQFRKFTLEQFGWMSTDQTNALSVQQLSTFKTAYRKTMTPEQRAFVDGALVYSRFKEHQAALETFGTMATSSYMLWSSLPPHWTATASGVAFAWRGAVFSVQSIFPNATAPHTKLGCALNLSSGLSFIVSSPGAAAPLIQSGSNPVVNGTFTLGNMIYGTKSTMQAFTGRTVMRLLGDHVGNAAYLGGSIAYTAQNLHSPLGWSSGVLFALGSAEFWASAIRADKLNRQPLPRTEADITAAAKSDKRWAAADRLALGVTFGAGMFLFAWDTLDGEPWKVAGTDGQNPGEPDPPATSVNLSPDDGVVQPDDTPPPPDPTDAKPADRVEPQFAITSEIGLSLRQAPNADADRLGVLRPGALVRETGSRKTDTDGTMWAPVRAIDVEGKEMQGWVRAEYLAAHPEGAQDQSGRFNPKLEKQGYRAIIVQNNGSIIGLAIHHQKSISATVALNLEHIANPSLLFAGDRIYLPR